jgi:hypothetical protein
MEPDEVLCRDAVSASFLFRLNPGEAGLSGNCHGSRLRAR